MKREFWKKSAEPDEPCHAAETPGGFNRWLPSQIRLLRLLRIKLLADAPDFHENQRARSAKYATKKNHHYIVHWSHSPLCDYQIARSCNPMGIILLRKHCQRMSFT
jgi:hypothetical protein